MPDMRTALTHALATGGVKPKAQVERIWLWIKDHPGSTSKRVRTELGIGESSCSSLISGLVKRKMLTPNRQEDRFGVTYRYSVTPGMQTYELLPVPTVKSTPTVKQTETKAEIQLKLPVQVVESQPQPKSSASATVDALTVAQARELYQILHSLFGKC